MCAVFAGYFIFYQWRHNQNLAHVIHPHKQFLGSAICRQWGGIVGINYPERTWWTLSPNGIFSRQDKENWTKKLVKSLTVYYSEAVKLLLAVTLHVCITGFCVHCKALQTSQTGLMLPWHGCLWGQRVLYLTRNTKLVLVREGNLRLSLLHSPDVQRGKRMEFCAQRLPTRLKNMEPLVHVCPEFFSSALGWS